MVYETSGTTPEHPGAVVTYWNIEDLKGFVIRPKLGFPSQPNYNEYAGKETTEFRLAWVPNSSKCQNGSYDSIFFGWDIVTGSDNGSPMVFGGFPEESYFVGSKFIPPYEILEDGEYVPYREDGVNVGDREPDTVSHTNYGVPITIPGLPLYIDYPTERPAKVFSAEEGDFNLYMDDEDDVDFNLERETEISGHNVNWIGKGLSDRRICVNWSGPDSRYFQEGRNGGLIWGNRNFEIEFQTMTSNCWGLSASINGVSIASFSIADLFHGSNSNEDLLNSLIIGDPFDLGEFGAAVEYPAIVGAFVYTDHDNDQEWMIIITFEWDAANFYSSYLNDGNSNYYQVYARPFRDSEQNEFITQDELSDLVDEYEEENITYDALLAEYDKWMHIGSFTAHTGNLLKLVHFQCPLYANSAGTKAIGGGNFFTPESNIYTDRLWAATGHHKFEIDFNFVSVLNATLQSPSGEETEIRTLTCSPSFSELAVSGGGSYTFTDTIEPKSRVEVGEYSSTFVIAADYDQEGAIVIATASTQWDLTRTVTITDTDTGCIKQKTMSMNGSCSVNVNGNVVSVNSTGGYDKTIISNECNAEHNGFSVSPYKRFKSDGTLVSTSFFTEEIDPGAPAYANLIDVVYKYDSNDDAGLSWKNYGTLQGQEHLSISYSGVERCIKVLSMDLRNNSMWYCVNERERAENGRFTSLHRYMANGVTKEVGDFNINVSYATGRGCERDTAESEAVNCEYISGIGVDTDSASWGPFGAWHNTSYRTQVGCCSTDLKGNHIVSVNAGMYFNLYYLVNIANKCLNANGEIIFTRHAMVFAGGSNHHPPGRTFNRSVFTDDAYGPFDLGSVFVEHAPTYDAPSDYFPRNDPFDLKQYLVGYGVAGGFIDPGIDTTYPPLKGDAYTWYTYKVSIFMAFQPFRPEEGTEQIVYNTLQMFTKHINVNGDVTDLNDLLQFTPTYSLPNNGWQGLGLVGVCYVGDPE